MDYEARIKSLEDRVKALENNSKPEEHPKEQHSMDFDEVVGGDSDAEGLISFGTAKTLATEVFDFFTNHHT